MDVILNEHTETVHRCESGSSGLETACGISSAPASERLRDRLQRLPLERAADEYDISKCGRCFDEGNGY